MDTPVGWLRSGLLDGSRHFFSIMRMLIVAFLISAAAGAIPIVGPIAVSGPMTCGVWAMLLAVSRHQNGAFSHLFDGFQVWGRAVVMSLVLGVFGTIILAVSLALGITIGNLSGSVAVPTIILFPLVYYVNVRLLAYVPALVVDRGFTAEKAMAANWRLTAGRKYHLFLLLTLPYTFLLLVGAFAIMWILGLARPTLSLGGYFLFLCAWGLMLCLLGAILFLPFVHAYNGRLREVNV